MSPRVIGNASEKVNEAESLLHIIILNKVLYEVRDTNMIQVMKDFLLTNRESFVLYGNSTCQLKNNADGL